MRIKKLPPELQSTFRTGITITDVTHCVTELVQNSLDAKATSIAVRLNLENFTLQVIDNGHGLSKEELDLIGKRYMTSKCYSIKDLKTNLSYYGFRGESIASIRESCGVLMVISKTQGCEQTYSKVFRANKESHSATVSSHNRLCIGTTVIIKDFLHNFPVRRSRIQPAFEMEYVRHCLIALSIINYKVSFTLRNDVTKLVILQTQEFNNSKEALKFHCNLNEKHDLVSVISNESKFKISAHISRQTETSSNFQFIYVNGRLVKNRRIYDIVNKHLSKSFFLRNIGKEVKESDDKPKEKASPVFIIHIQCPYSEYDIYSDPKKIKVEFKKWNLLEENLGKVVEKFVLSESSLYDTSELRDNLHQNIESNVDVSTAVNYDNLTVKSNVMYSKSVTRPISEAEDLRNTCENHVESNYKETNKFVGKKLTVEKKRIENKVNLKQSNGIYNHNRSKDVKNVIDEINLSCQNQQEINIMKRCIPFNEISLSEDECGVNKTKELFLASAESVMAVFNKTEIKKKLCKKSVSYNSINIIQTNPIRNCNVNSRLKNLFPFKAPRPISRPMKRKRLSEHILTESETSTSPAKKNCCLETVGLINHKNNLTLTSHKASFVHDYNPRPVKKKHFSEHILTESDSAVSSVKHINSSFPSDSPKNNHEQKSILPIIVPDFFNDAVKSMYETQNIFNNFVENNYEETPRNRFNMQLHRSLKEVPNSNSVRLTQKNTLKFLDYKTGYHVKCSKGTKYISVPREKCSKNVTSKSKIAKVIFPKAFKHGIKISQDNNKMRNTISSKLNNSNQENVKSSEFNQNWKVFSPPFTKVKRTIRNKTIVKSKCQSKVSDFKINNTKPALCVKRVKTFSFNKGISANGQFSSLTNQVYQVPCKSILKQGQTETSNKEKHFQVRNKSKGGKHLYVNKMKDAVTQTSAHVHYNPENIKHERTQYNPQGTSFNEDHFCKGTKNNSIIRKQVTFEKFPNIESTNKSMHWANMEKSLSSLTLFPSPNLTNSGIKESDITHNGVYKTQQSRYFKQSEACSGKSKNISLWSPKQSVVLSPILPDFTFHLHSPIINHKTQCVSLASKLKNDESFSHKQIYEDLDTNFFNFSQHKTDFRSCSRELGYDSSSINPFFDFTISEHINSAPTKEIFRGDRHESISVESNSHLNPLNYKNSNSIWQGRSQNNLFFKESFNVSPNKIPEILKYCHGSPIHQNISNRSNIKTKDEISSKNGEISVIESSIVNKDLNCNSLANHTSNKPSAVLKTENVIDFAKQCPLICQETISSKNKINELTHNAKIDQCCSNIKDDTVRNCDNKIISNAPDSNNRNSMFENVVCTNKNSLTGESKLNNFLGEEKEPSWERFNQNLDKSHKNVFTNWNKELTSSGKVFYINNLTGMSSFISPKIVDLDTEFVLENRHWFIPRGVSPILHVNGDYKNQIKQLSESERGTVENIITANNVELATVKWRNGSVSQGTEAVVNILNGKENNRNWTTSTNFKKSCSFSSESLSTAQVLGQVDRKFIAALMRANEEINILLVLFDQHAVDERIQLESLISGYKNVDGQLASHPLNPFLEINLSENDTTLLKELLPRTSKLGLKLLLEGDKVIVDKVPLCLFNRYTREGENKEWLSNMVAALVKQLLASMQDSQGVIPSMPSLLSDLISTEACRGSIKFGDLLTLDQCRRLISKLANCEVPFQCAHGRPVLTPLTEIKEEENVVEPTNLKTLSKRIQSKVTETV